MSNSKQCEKDEGYVVVCRVLPDSDDSGDVIFETYMEESSLSDAKERAATVRSSRNPRIAKLHFID